MEQNRRVVRKLFIALMVALVVGRASFAEGRSHPKFLSPDFADFPAKIYRGPLARPTEDFPWPQMERGLKKGINFGGHFLLAGIP